jgi:hypothetical protein
MEKGWFVFVGLGCGLWGMEMDYGFSDCVSFFMGYDYYYLLFENEKG